MLPKIVFVRGLLTVYGGAEHTVALLAREMKLSGYDVTFVMRPPVNKAHPYYKLLAEAGIPVLAPATWSQNRFLKAAARLFSWALLLPYWIYRRQSFSSAWRAVQSIGETLLVRFEERGILRIFDRLRADGGPMIVHIYGPEGLTPLLAQWGKRNQVPVVYNESTEADENCVDKFSMRWTLEAINDIPLVICCSPRVSENIRQVYGYRGAIVEIPFLIAEPREVADKRPGTAVVLGTVGRVVEHKRHQDVVQAVAELRQKGWDVEMVIGGNGPMKPLLELQARQLQIESFVSFLGNFRDISEVMAQIDIFVLPSFSEAQPLAIAEAMAYGKPVISTNFGGIPDMVIDGETGFLIEPGDLKSLLDVLERLVANAELRRSMGERGREVYLKTRKPAVVVDKVEAAYASALADFIAVVQ